MSNRTLVGRGLDRVFSLQSVVQWAASSWLEPLGYIPEVVTLTRRWFAFNFLQPGHLQWVLNRNWKIDHTPLLLKPWHPLFDASRERVGIVPLWVRLPGLPLHYWTEEHLQNIGNILGTFLEADLSFLETRQKKVARILVSLNIREGLAEKMNLSWGPYVNRQILDYENVPFRCRRCHAYGHSVSDCRLPVRTLNGRRKQKSRKEAGSAEVLSGPPSSMPTTPQEPVSDEMEENRQEEEALVAGPVVEVVRLAEALNLGDPSPGDNNQEADKASKEGLLMDMED